MDHIFVNSIDENHIRGKIARGEMKIREETSEYIHVEELALCELTPFHQKFFKSKDSFRMDYVKQFNETLKNHYGFFIDTLDKIDKL